jgi:hypothetical protein
VRLDQSTDSQVPHFDADISKWGMPPWCRTGTWGMSLWWLSTRIGARAVEEWAKATGRSIVENG